MQSSTIKFWVCSGSLLFYLLAPKPTTAQIVPDTTLPNNSIVLPNGNKFEINGGTTVGNNLFHSFEKFSIPDGGSANFNNAMTIQNIITRVTGNDVSNINGTINAIGTANLFLLNPNGIIFGPNAQLKIGGSFIASTANSLKFADGTEFRTDGTQTTPLLTMSVPMGLQFGVNPQPIRYQSPSQSESLDFTVSSGKTLALVGGDVEIQAGVLGAPEGRIELGSAAGNNSVSLNPIEQGWKLDYKDTQNFQDILISRNAIVDTTGNQGGDIQIQGRNVKLTEGSQVRSVAKSSTAGNVKVSASEQVELVNDRKAEPFTGLFNQVEGKATGEDRTLTIETKRLILRGGTQVSTDTFGEGQAPDLRVNASEFIQLEGGSPLGPSVLSAQVLPKLTEGGTLTEASGKGPTLTIDTRQLIVRDGAQVSSSTFGAGDAGDLKVTASEFVRLEGRSSDNRPSGLFAKVEINPYNPQEVTTGNGGNLTINTPKLEVLGGAQISAATPSQGSGGTLTINAPNSILVSGSSQQTQEPLTATDTNRSNITVSAAKNATGDAGALNINTGLLTVEKNARISADTLGSGNAGTATLNVRQLVVSEGGEVRAASFDSGAAGNLFITANNIRLNNGKLTATTNAGEGGNIRLQNVDQLLMENNSLISAKASNNANGGNINIDAANGTIVGVPGQNNDLVASAITGKGGDITIKTSGIYGFEERKSTPANTTNDIDASSQFGLPGTVNINRSDADPTQALVELPANVVDPSKQIASSCGSSNVANSSEFFITGRGGLPPNPNEPLSTDVIWSDTRIPKITAQQQPSEVAAVKPAATQADTVKIVPATGWVFNGKGQVTLISTASTNNAHPSLQNSASCASR